MNDPYSTENENADRFEREYPEELPDRLQWLEDCFRIDHKRLVRLLGLSPEETAELERRDWGEIVRRFEVRAGFIEHCLSGYLASFRYDREAALRSIDSLADKVRSGEINLEMTIPWYRPERPLWEREEAILNTLRYGGNAYLALPLFLSQAASVEAPLGSRWPGCP